MKFAGIGMLALALLSPVLGGDKTAKALEGKWQAKLKDEQIEFVVKGKMWTMELKELTLKGTWTIDTKVNPHTLDLKIEDAGGELDKFKGQTSLAIFEINDDSLRISAAEPGKTTRPSDYASRDGQVLLEFKRVK